MSVNEPVCDCCGLTDETTPLVSYESLLLRKGAINFMCSVCISQAVSSLVRLERKRIRGSVNLTSVNSGTSFAKTEGKLVKVSK